MASQDMIQMGFCFRDVIQFLIAVIFFRWGHRFLPVSWSRATTRVRRVQRVLGAEAADADAAQLDVAFTDLTLAHEAILQRVWISRIK